MDAAALISRLSTGTYVILRRASLGYVKGRASPDLAVGTFAAWAVSHAYTAGARVTNDTAKIYECITSGTSAASGGPTGTGANITDNTAHWRYIGVTFSTLAAVVPAKGTDLLRLPEARRTETTLVVFSPVALQAGGQGQASEADLITIRGVLHEIQTVETWDSPTFTTGSTGWKAIVQQRAT